MTKESQTAGVVSGSFKFKREIDLVIEEFEDNGINILSPEKGPLLIIKSFNFHPLKSEKYLPIKRVEDNHLNAIKRSEFLYIADIEGYYGESTGFEIGGAMAWGKPIYLKEPLCEQMRIEMLGEMTGNIPLLFKVRTPTEVAKMALNHNYEIDGYWWCN